VRLWDVATAGATTTLTGHTDEVESVAFNPDGKTLATAGYDQTIRLWDPAAARTSATLIGHSSGVTSVAFSPDGKTLASGGQDHTVRLWDLATGRGRTARRPAEPMRMSAGRSSDAGPSRPGVPHGRGSMRGT
jgi:WD40 repeat protein